MTIKIIEKKIKKLSSELEELKKNLAQLKQEPEKRITGRKRSVRTKKADMISIGLELPGNALQKVTYPKGITLEELIIDCNLNIEGLVSVVNGSKVEENYELQNGDIVWAELKTKNAGRKKDFKNWQRLADEISKRWIGNRDAVEEVRYQRSKYD
ncbi:MAG: hypothetical protein R6W90_16105 [Ignavibacteriaceae bacterium]